MVEPVGTRTVPFKLEFNKAKIPSFFSGQSINGKLINCRFAIFKKACVLNVVWLELIVNVEKVVVSNAHIPTSNIFSGIINSPLNWFELNAPLLIVPSDSGKVKVPVRFLLVNAF
jgi:hypothetical protein